MLNKNNTFKFDKTHRGFTMVEMMVSIAIAVFIMSVILFNQSHYTDSASLLNEANSIDLYLRQSQIYGISVKQFKAGSSDFSIAYGMDFNISSYQGDNKSYILFADRGNPGNKIYDSGSTCPTGDTSECIQKVNILNGNYIDKLCVIYLNNSEDCDTIGRLDFSFIRPDPEANIVFFDKAGNTISLSNIKGARIKLLSLNNNGAHSVVVYTTGQISVQ